MDAQSDRSARRARAPIGRSRQSRNRDSVSRRKLRSTRSQCIFPVGERVDRHRASSRAWHGGADVNRCRWTPDRCAARRMHLRQRDVLWFDPWRARHYQRARRTSSRCRRSSRELDDTRQDGAGNGGSHGPGVGRQTRDHRHAAHGERKSKIVQKCTLPLTSARRIDLVVTDLAVIGFPGGKITLLETAPGVSVAEVIAATEADLSIPNNVPEMKI
jgi:hypothetical protein